jgi:hypothetical protein
MNDQAKSIKKIKDLLSEHIDTYGGTRTSVNAMGYLDDAFSECNMIVSRVLVTKTFYVDVLHKENEEESSVMDKAVEFTLVLDNVTSESSIINCFDDITDYDVEVV